MLNKLPREAEKFKISLDVAPGEPNLVGGVLNDCRVVGQDEGPFQPNL